MLPSPDPQGGLDDPRTGAYPQVLRLCFKDPVMALRRDLLRHLHRLPMRPYFAYSSHTVDVAGRPVGELGLMRRCSAWCKVSLSMLSKVPCGVLV